MESRYKVDRLGLYINQIRGISYKPDDIMNELTEGYKVVLRANSIKENKLKLEDLVYVKESLIKDIQLIKANDILMAASSGSKEIVGKSVQIYNDTEFTFGAFCKLIRCKETINAKYVSYFFRTTYYRTTISNLVCGANINNLKNEYIDNLMIPLPSSEIQDKIVKVLDKSQELIDKRKAQIEALDELVKSQFIEMFGDPITNSKGWNRERLIDLGELARGKSKHRPRNAPELLNGPYPLVQTGDIANAGIYLKEYTQTYSELGLKQSKMWERGTLCITIAANIAKTSILTFDACFPDSVVAFIPNEKTNNMFIQLWMSFLQKILEDSAPESAQKNINLKILSEQNVIVPPIELQNQFADFVNQVDKLKFEMQKSLEEMENNFNSLMQRAFNGELFS